MSAHEGTVSESKTPETEKCEDRKWKGKDLYLQFFSSVSQNFKRCIVNICLFNFRWFPPTTHLLCLVLQALIKEQIDSMFFLSAPDDEILDRKMQQPLKSINTSFISCLTTTDIRTDWFFAFSRLECWLCLNHKCALDDGILDKKMQRPLKPTTLFVGKLYGSAHWQCHCLAVIITIVIIITIIIATSSA